MGNEPTKAVANLEIRCGAQATTRLHLSSGALAKSATGGRAFGADLSGNLTDVVWAATRVALARVERVALERLRRRLEQALGCPDGPLTQTCRAIRSVRLSQLDTVAPALARALRADVVAAMIGAARRAAWTGRAWRWSYRKQALISLIRTLVNMAVRFNISEMHGVVARLINSAPRGPQAERALVRLIQAGLGAIVAEAPRLDQIRGALAQVLSSAPPEVRNALRAALWCQARTDCSLADFANPVVTSAFDPLNSPLAQAFVEFLRTAEEGSPQAIGRAARGLLASEAFLELLKVEKAQFRDLMAFLGPDWVRAVPALCGLLGHETEQQCLEVVGPLVAALGPIIEAASTPATTSAEREARREAIASAIERVAEMQTDRSERADELIWSVAMGFDAGYQVAAAHGGARIGATLGVAADFEAWGQDQACWLHLMIGLVDTTQLVTSELNDGESTEESFESELDWQDVFLPSVRIGLGLGNRELPLTIWGGIGWARIAEEGPEAAAIFGISLHVPLFDLN